jgi:hypothetical protein
MSDASDVLSTLGALIAGYLYPNGSGQTSVTSNQINVMDGWPLPDQIDCDMPQGIADVSTYPVPGTERNVTRYAPKSHVMSIVKATLTLTVSGNTITVGGAMPSPFTPHNMAVMIAGKAFIYPIQVGDALTSIATGLAALIAAAYPGTTSSGAVITLAAGANVQAARVGTTGTTAIEWERQVQTFQITVWAPDPVTRSTIASAIKVALAQISFITMPDGFGARIRYLRNAWSDATQKERTYRRDLFYDIEYATTVTKNIATVVATEVQFQDKQGDPVATRTY